MGKDKKMVIRSTWHGDRFMVLLMARGGTQSRIGGVKALVAIDPQGNVEARLSLNGAALGCCPQCI